MTGSSSYHQLILIKELPNKRWFKNKLGKFTYRHSEMGSWFYHQIVLIFESAKKSTIKKQFVSEQESKESVTVVILQLRLVQDTQRMAQKLVIVVGRDQRHRLLHPPWVINSAMEPLLITLATMINISKTFRPVHLLEMLRSELLEMKSTYHHRRRNHLLSMNWTITKPN